MIRFLFFFSLITITHLYSVEAPAAIAASVDTRSPGITRVVGGVNAQSGAWPFMASIQKRSAFSFNWSHSCGGTLIAPSWVLTAAHCVEDEIPLSRIRVALGIHDLYSGSPNIHTIHSKIIHPSYNSRTLDSDLALLRLSQAASQSPVNLIDSDSLQQAGTTATLIGWGATAEGGGISRNLQQVDVPVLSQSTCNAFQVYNGDLTSNMLCAGYLVEEKDACNGDSGGPLVVYSDSLFKQIGIVSWGQGCARPNKPGVYTRIRPFVNWIQSTIGSDQSDEEEESSSQNPPSEEVEQEDLSISLSEALDYPNSSFQTGGSLPWMSQTHTTTDDQSAAQSGKIGSRQSSWIYHSFEGPGVLRFFWKVSSEPDHDYLAAYLNRREIGRLSGAVDWVEESVVLPAGEQGFRWMFRKDWSQNWGADKGYLDQISYSRGALSPSTNWIDFGEVVLGSSPAPRVIEFLNQNPTEELLISSLSLRGFHRRRFSISSDECSTNPLPSNQSCSVQLNFTPDREGWKRAYVLAMVDRRSGYQEWISVSANVIPTSAQIDENPPLPPSPTLPQTTLTPARVSFGSQPIGTESPPVVITLSNTGTSILTLDSILIPSNEQREIRVLEDHCSQSYLGSLAECEITLSFTPKYVGVIQTTLVLRTSDGNTAGNVPLSGKGISLEEVFGADGFTLEHGGVLPFTAAHDETSSRYVLRSGSILDSQSSWFEMNVSGPAHIGFQIQTSTEEVQDRFQLLVDGTLRFSLSGEIPWAPQRVVLSKGNHTLRFAYQKNPSLGSGLDQILLKDFFYLPEGVHLRPGWNQITSKQPRSVPIEEYFDSRNFSTFNQPFSVVWGWDAARRRYEIYIPEEQSRELRQDLLRAYAALEKIEPGRSYWIHMKEASVFYFE